MLSNRDGGALRAVHAGPGAAAFGDGDRAGGDHAGADGAAGVLLLALLLSGKHGPAVVPDRGGDTATEICRRRKTDIKEQHKKDYLI